jgi:AraC family transcriptional regulator of arabinose operon
MPPTLDCMYYSAVADHRGGAPDAGRDEQPTRVDHRHHDPGQTPGAERTLSAGLFSAGSNYGVVRPNGRSDWLFFLTLSGSGTFRAAQEAAVVDAHTVSVYLEGAAQDYGTSATEWTFAFAHVRPRVEWVRAVSSWPSPWKGLSVLRVPDHEVWARAWGAMANVRRTLASPLRTRRAMALNALEQVILWCDEVNPGRGPTPDPRIRRAAELAGRSVRRMVTVAELAAEAGLSPSRLTVLFRDQLGEAPARYAERLRLEHAANLLAASGLSVKEAAAAVGYEDTFHFSRRFAARMGRPPSRWSAG